MQDLENAALSEHGKIVFAKMRTVREHLARRTAFTTIIRKKRGFGRSGGLLRYRQLLCS